MMIVIDYDAGNTANVLRALKSIGVEAVLSANPEKIRKAQGLILLGVGAFPSAMAELEKRQLIPAIKEAVAGGTPLLGICLGMQLLLEEGLEHQPTQGLGLIMERVGQSYQRLDILSPTWDGMFCKRDNRIHSLVIWMENLSILSIVILQIFPMNIWM